MIVYHKKNNGMKGAPKWGAFDGENFKHVRALGKNNFFNSSNITLFKAWNNDEEKAKIKPGKRLFLDYFTLFKSKINPPDENGEPTNKSYIEFRFHSSVDFAKMSVQELLDKHDAIYVRSFEYNGVDKTEGELIDWAINTAKLKANDNKTTIYKAVDVAAKQKDSFLRADKIILEKKENRPIEATIKKERSLFGKILFKIQKFLVYMKNLFN